MKKLVCVATILISFFIIFPNVGSAEDYVLGPRDVLSIGVWGFEELQVKEIAVRDDGKIAFPLVGEVQVGGLSPGEVTQKITVALQEYVNSPKVTVNIIKFRTTRIYVLGEVNRPGLYEIDKQHRLLDAIGMAGGYTKDAAKKKIFIIHKDNKDKPIKANLLSLLKNGDMTQNYALAEGDVVFLSGNNRLDIARDILPYINTMIYSKDVNND